jgi:signal transduction histidine kinase/ligand-binding sensor domain-containing protein/CheY-like chemotaxis protein/AraC-like DNA-binding protein
MKCLWIILGIIITPLWVFSQYQNLNFQNSPGVLGLNYTSVVDIAQDSRGYLWFCTYVGLYRYNGNSVKHYTFKGNLEVELSSNKVISILSTRNDELFAATLLGSVMKYNFEQDSFQFIKEENAHTLRQNMWSLYEDKNGSLWCGTERGIAILDYQSEVLRNDKAFLRSNVNNKKINYITSADTEYIWVGSDDGLFVYYVSDDGEISELNHIVFDFPGYTSEQSNFISHIARTGDSLEDKVKVFCKSGIIDLDFSKGFDRLHYELVNPTDENFAFPRALVPLMYHKNEYLIGTNDGTKIYYGNQYLSEETFLQDVIVRDIFEDHFGTVWLGTESGLYILDQNPAQFRNVSIRNNFLHNTDLIEGIASSPKTEDLWVYWQNGQITRIVKLYGNYQFQKAEHYDILLDNNTLFSDRISYVEIDKEGQIWLATQGAGVVSFNENQVANGKPIRTELELNDRNGLVDNYIMSIEVESDGVWMGTWKNGLIYYDKKRGKSSGVPYGKGDGVELRTAPIMRLAAFYSGGSKYLAIGTGGEGVFIERIDKNPFSIESIHLHSKGSTTSRINNNFTTDLIYHDNQLYIGSENGLDIYNVNNKEIDRNYNEKSISQIITQGIKPLMDGSVWVSTHSNGILKVNPKDSLKPVKHYIKDVYSNYVMSPIILDSENLLMFAGTEGLTVVNPFSTVEIEKPPIPMITGLRINNSEIKKGSNEKGSNYTTISEMDKINLSYKDKIITFELNAMHTADRQPLTYAYMLEGFNEDWVYTSENENLINFTNLPYSSFKFHFKAANSNDKWSEPKSLEISIEPPWWKSNLAYFIYLISCVAFIVAIIKLFNLRQQYRQNLKLAELEKDKAEELNKLKLDFYTAISHELRTPLTMIIAPIEQLLKNPSLVEKSGKSLEFINNNAKKLLRMVNQLLDIRKLESKMVYLNLHNFDFVEFINEIVSSFKPALTSKDISIFFDFQVKKLTMAFDEDEMEKVFSNLFTNAMKYTNPGGHIKIALEHDENKKQVKVLFSDDGAGIKKKELPFIFDQYYQTEEHIHEGYGLGLSIVKSIIELHKGKITVESEVNEGTLFQIDLPTDLRAISHNSNDVLPLTYSNGKPNETEDLYTEDDHRIKILIVEDSPDIKEFLKENLIEKFDILLASDGEEGLQMAIVNVPDLIITDIAMPKMDGLEMCKGLKNNAATSHIPVIVLTARTSMNFKLQGYEYGINAFITKPFNLELLNKQIDSTLDYLEIVKQKYQRNLEGVDDHAFFPKLPGISSGDEEFVQSITDFIMQNIGNSDLAIEDIAGGMNMSQVQFYRKLKAITGITPKRMLRELRLHRAKQLLEQTDMNISEVTYAVGFNDLKYFRSKFKEMFDSNPSEIKKANKVTGET